MTEGGAPWDRWTGLPTATISDCLDRLQAMHAGIRRISDGDLVGPAFTIETCAGDSTTIHRAVEVAPAGSVLVISSGDIVVGDADGVVVVPPFRAQALKGEVQARTIQENEWMDMIRSGRTTADLLGLGGVPGRAENLRDGS